MTREEILSMSAGRELDALVAEKVMGIDLKPHRDVALAQIGWKYVSVTGPVFKLKTGDELALPNGRELRKPEGTDDWNARYTCKVGEFLAEKYPYIAQEVEDYRLEARPYSTDISAAW